MGKNIEYKIFVSKDVWLFGGYGFGGLINCFLVGKKKWVRGKIKKIEILMDF